MACNKPFWEMHKNANFFSNLNKEVKSFEFSEFTDKKRVYKLLKGLLIFIHSDIFGAKDTIWNEKETDFWRKK